MSETTRIECPVCATWIHEQADVCTRCQTPHHGDCAQFIGQCAVFGCGGKAFVQQAVENIGLHAAESIREGSSSTISPAARCELRRGVLDRVVAAGRLLWANPQITVPLVLVMLPFNFGFGRIFLFLAMMLCQAALVILFVARAKGKDSTVQSAMLLGAARAPRILWTTFKGQVIIYLYMMAGAMCGVLGIGLFGAGPVGALVGVVFCGLGVVGLLYAVRKMFAFSLSSIVAALGAQEEPGSPLERSEALFAVAPSQGVLAILLLMVLNVPAMAVAETGLDSFVLDALMGLYSGLTCLLWACFWMLFYLEARKVLKANDLPFVPSEYVPPSNS